MNYMSPKSTTRHVPQKYHKINMALSPESTTRNNINYFILAADYLKPFEYDLLFETDCFRAPLKRKKLYLYQCFLPDDLLN